MLLKILSLVLFISPVMGATLSEKADPIKQCESALTDGSPVKKGVLKEIKSGVQKGNIPGDKAAEIIEAFIKRQAAIPWQQAFWYQAYWETIPNPKKEAAAALIIESYGALAVAGERIFESDFVLIRYLIKEKLSSKVTTDLADYLLAEMPKHPKFNREFIFDSYRHLIVYGAKEHAIPAIKGTLDLIGKDKILSLKGWSCLKMAFRRTPSSDRENLTSVVLGIADTLMEADLVRCYTSVLQYASSPQKGAILEKATVIYGVKIRGGQSLSPDDLSYLQKAWVYMYGDPSLRKPLVALMKEIMARDGMIPMKDRSIWELWLSRW